MSKSRRLRAGVVTTGLFASLLVPLGFPGVAQARCAGVNHPVVSTLSSFVEEKPKTGSCNNNNTYTGLFHSTLDYTWPVVLIQNNGQWVPYTGYGDRSWKQFSYIDSNSHSLMVLCITSSDRYSVWYCGWGNNYTEKDYIDLSGIIDNADAFYYGVNFGF